MRVYTLSRPEHERMLNLFPESEPVWFDLYEPTAEEVARVSHEVGAPLPGRQALEEIETSSRLRATSDSLTMSMPTSFHDEDNAAQVAPVGFVLTERHLVTIRYARLPSFDDAAADCRAADGKISSLDAFAGLAEEMVDRLADTLESIAGQLGLLSEHAFRDPVADRQADKAKGGPRDRMRQVGRLGDQTSNIRDALLGLGRVVNFVTLRTAAWPQERPVARLTSLHDDVASLNDYANHLSEKVQFLLDAMVGMIGIAQNEVFKILTIVSIMGIPPTLIASIYGMNFKIIPELQWRYGYPYALAMIVLSAILPLVWFKWRRWF
jgi:magnesium transporter